MAEAVPEDILVQARDAVQEKLQQALESAPAPLEVPNSVRTIHGHVVDDDMLKAMLIREEQLRVSPEAQAVFAAYEERQDVDWMEHAVELQKQVLCEFGFPDDDQALLVLRRAALRMEFPIYVRNNRADRGPLKVGDQAPQIMLHSMDGTMQPVIPETTLPVVIVSGSRS